MKLYDIYSGTVIGSFPDDLRSGKEKRRDRRKGEKGKWRKIQEYEQTYFGGSNKSRRSVILKRK